MENKYVWIVTIHKGQGNENIIKSFAEYKTAIKYLEKANITGATLKKVDFIDENQTDLSYNTWKGIQ